MWLKFICWLEFLIMFMVLWYCEFSVILIRNENSFLLFDVFVASTWSRQFMDPSSNPYGSLSLSLSASLYGIRDVEEPDFVNPDNKYRCTACQRYLRDPLQTTCGHRICRACFEENLISSGPEGFMCLAQEDECEVINRQKVCIYFNCYLIYARGKLHWFTSVALMLRY